MDQDWCTGSTSDESGTTATLGVIQGQRLTIAHVGDTRAISIKKDGSCALSMTLPHWLSKLPFLLPATLVICRFQHQRARISSSYHHNVYAGEVLTTSHRASNAEERERVLARGGDVPECSKGECARVNGLIEVTRSLGDRWLKPVLDCTPEVVARDLTSDDAFLVIGSDGLFDSVDDATVV